VATAGYKLFKKPLTLCPGVTTGNMRPLCVNPGILKFVVRDQGLRLQSEHGVQGVARMGFGFETDSVTHDSLELFLLVCADTGSTGKRPS